MQTQITVSAVDKEDHLRFKLKLQHLMTHKLHTVYLPFVGTGVSKKSYHLLVM
jgi:hypothetical protein